MTTILILTIDSDGRTLAYSVDKALSRYAVSIDWLSTGSRWFSSLTPTRSGDDRGHYDVFEVAGVSIDVTRMPQRTDPDEYLKREV